MIKVYILIEWDDLPYLRGEEIGIFSSLEKAQTFLKEHEEDYMAEKYKVIEVELDSLRTGNEFLLDWEGEIIGRKLRRPADDLE